MYDNNQINQVEFIKFAKSRDTYYVGTLKITLANRLKTLPGPGNTVSCLRKM